jgi:hypothetical protein
VVSFGMGITFETPVIPAKAGIQSVGGAFPMACAVDSRLRGNDGTWGRPCFSNDTTTRIHPLHLVQIEMLAPQD